jgi:AcrR family transcriptional regulator
MRGQEANTPDSGPPPLKPADVEAARLARSDRRDALLDVAAAMISGGEVEDVSMESVAERARVSRALVYKHFANRQDLIGAVYERESAHIHVQLTAAVVATSNLADMLRALVRGALAMQATRGATLAALTSSGGRTAHQREVQRDRDRLSLRFFTRQAMKEFDLDEDTAKAGIGIALESVTTVLARWRRHPTSEHAKRLEDIYVSMTIGGLRELSADARAPDTRPSHFDLGD